MGISPSFTGRFKKINILVARKFNVEKLNLVSGLKYTHGHTLIKNIHLCISYGTYILECLEYV